MNIRILISAVIGAALVAIFYPAPEVTSRLIAAAAAFFVLLGILFCTMLIGMKDAQGTATTKDKPCVVADKSSTAGKV